MRSPLIDDLTAKAEIEAAHMLRKYTQGALSGCIMLAINNLGITETRALLKQKFDHLAEFDKGKQ
jgi:hypothetical protein